MLWGRTVKSLALGGEWISAITLANRLRDKVRNSDDLSINVLELLGMDAMALAFIILGENTPQYPRETIMMRGDNMSAFHWVNHCRGGK